MVQTLHPARPIANDPLYLPISGERSGPAAGDPLYWPLFTDADDAAPILKPPQTAAPAAAVSRPVQPVQQDLVMPLQTNQQIIAEWNRENWPSPKPGHRGILPAPCFRTDTPARSKRSRRGSRST